MEQTVQSPDQGHDARRGSEAHGHVAKTSAAQTRSDHVAGLDLGSDDAVEHLPRTVDQHVCRIDGACEGLGDEFLLDHGRNTGGEIFASQIATGVGQEAVQEQLGGADADAARGPAGLIVGSGGVVGHDGLLRIKVQNEVCGGIVGANRLYGGEWSLTLGVCVGE